MADDRKDDVSGDGVAAEAGEGAQRLVVLAGGFGGARFLRGLRLARPEAHITAIINTGDDITVHGLRVCPDLDTVMYTLGEGLDTERGWGRAAETFTVQAELGAYQVGPAWFGLGDRDLATHLVRTQMLDAGYPLSQVTAALCQRWQPGVALLPMTDDRVETRVVVDRGEGLEAIHFQEWWLRHHAELPAVRIVAVGADTATPAPGVLEAITAADAVLLAPSNPVVSIGTILGVPGVRPALEAARVVGLSPVISGRPLRGMADACLASIRVASTAGAIGRFYGSPLLDGWLVDVTDLGATVPGVTVRAVPLLMESPEATAAMAEAALDLAGV